MRLEDIRNQVLEIVTKNPMGFTFNPRVNRMHTCGYVVASIDTQDCFGKRGLFKVIKFVLRNNNYCIGGWKNEDGSMQFDASRVFNDIDTAIMNAIENRQRAIYNLYTGKVIKACEYKKYLSPVACVA